MICCVAALVMGGCGSSSSDSSNKQQPAKQKTTKPSSGGGTAVVMKQIQFQPADVTVKKGASVTWTNDDSVGHDVTKKSGPGAKFSSGSPGGLQGGDTFKQKFDTPGTIIYVCTVHPNMKGTITVK
jgi:plastocyanin